jgi:putative DNA primase/helicase
MTGIADVFEQLAPGPVSPSRPKRDAYREALQTHTTPPAPPPPSVILECGSNLNPQPVDWLWPGYLARGKFTLLAGQGGTGKTTLAGQFAANLTSGSQFPDGAWCAPGNILIWSGEDDPADTLLPRLIAAGAERSRCFFVKASRIEGETVPFDPSRDLLSLLSAIDDIGGVDLLIVDPVVSAVTGDSHKNTEVRRALQPLVDLAAATRAAVLGISHFSKGGQGLDPTQRVIGSVAFAAVARVVLVAAKIKGEEGEDKRILARSKSNIGPDDGGFEYTLEQIEALPGIEASRVVWGAAVEGTARELLTDPATDDEGHESAGDAAELLRECLTGPGWFPAKDATRTMTDAGFTKKQIWAASKKINVSRRKGAMNEGWYWRIPGGGERAFSMSGPEDSIEDSEGSSVRNVECSESSAESSPTLERSE